MNSLRRLARRRPFRDTENAIFLGVCAGLADLWQLPALGLRVIAVILLLLAFWPVLLVYLTAAVLLPDRPLSYRGSRREQDFWRSGSYQ